LRRSWLWLHMIRFKGYAMNKPNLQATIARMKSEILADIAAGTVPATVASFSELHEYVDANEYGGFCDAEYVARFGLPSDEGYPDSLTDFANAAQDSIHAWLVAGEHRISV
jgi:hypothetical protein